MCIQQHHFDRNRKAVQQGLDRRKEARAEAAQEAAGRELRAAFRQSNQRREQEKAAAEAAVCRHVAQVVEETDREIEQATAKLRMEQNKRDRKALEAKQWNIFLLLTFGSLMIAVATVKLFDTGLLPIWVFIPVAFLACIFSVWNFVAYATRNIRKGE